MTDFVRAKFEFHAENEAELSFRVGDIITVLSRDDEGWWEGELGGRRGLFPANYCEPWSQSRTGGSMPPPLNNSMLNRTNTSSTASNSALNRSNTSSNSSMLNGRNGTSSSSTGSPPMMGMSNKMPPPIMGGMQYSNSGMRNSGGRGPSMGPPPPPVGMTNNKYNNNMNNNMNNSNMKMMPGSPSMTAMQPVNAYNMQMQNVGSPSRGAMPMQPMGQQPPPTMDLNMNKQGPAGGGGGERAAGGGGKGEREGGGAMAVPKYDPNPLSSVAKNTTRFGFWASNFAVGAGAATLLTGLSALFWHFQNPDQFAFNYLWTGIYSIASGVGVILFEMLYWNQRAVSRLPWRAVIYALISVPEYFSELTAYCGVFYVSVAVIELAASYNDEEYQPPKARPAQAKPADDMAGSLCDAVTGFVSKLGQENKVGEFIFMSFYWLGNAALFADTTYVYWISIANTAPATQTTEWIAFAKGFGYVLDMDCALILLPVCRTMLRALYNISTKDQGIVARTIRGILFFIPVDHNLKFHRIVAWTIAVAALGHTVSHIVNYALRPSITFNIYGLWPLLSGGILVHIMLFMYASSLSNTKNAQFEVFWYTHHLFVFFFIFLLVHGRGGLGPHFWFCFIGPGTIYVIERLLRLYRSYKKVVVLSVTLMGDVFCIEMEKSGIWAEQHKEGQYVFINAPSVSSLQWHPFTISAAPQQKTVTLHIKVQGPGSWTRRVRDYLAAMGPRNRSWFALDRAGPSGKLPGKIVGPDNNPMFRLDGPYAAPTQHLGEYDVDVIVGAGIGVTPVASSLRSVIFHRWKYYIGQCYPDHAYFVFVCAYKDIDGFRWLLRVMKEAQDEVVHMRTTNPQAMQKKTFEVHIYVTSVPEKRTPIPPRPATEEEEVRMWGKPLEETQVDRFRATKWDEHMLYGKMLDPAPHTIMGYDEVSLTNTATPAGGVSVVSDVHVYAGRPRWDNLFNRVSRKHADTKIGVEFCGNPAIGKDLSKICLKMNKTRKDRFVLYKENF